jgi:two-component system, cell cycle sensor histidine kinase and response regulator CckA
LSTDDVGPDVKLSVQDSGIGMEPATLERAFEPFFSTKADGTGLGLSTVYGIVTQSGGRVGIESEPSKGTTVAIVLPAVEAPATDERPAAPADPSKSVAGTETVLLTADDTSVALLIESFMSRLGYRVLQTVSIDDATRVAGSYGKPIDLAIIGLRDDDAAMPFVDALRRVHAELPALLLTSFSPDPQKGIAEDSRTTVLAKPFALAELAAAARKLLDN